MSSYSYADEWTYDLIWQQGQGMHANYTSHNWILSKCVTLWPMWPARQIKELAEYTILHPPDDTLDGKWGYWVNTSNTKVLYNTSSVKVLHV